MAYTKLLYADKGSGMRGLAMEEVVVIGGTSKVV